MIEPEELGRQRFASVMVMPAATDGCCVQDAPVSPVWLARAVPAVSVKLSLTNVATLRLHRRAGGGKIGCRLHRAALRHSRAVLLIAHDDACRIYQMPHHVTRLSPAQTT